MRNGSVFAVMATVQSGDVFNIGSSQILNGDPSIPASRQRPLFVGRNTLRAPRTTELNVLYVRFHAVSGTDLVGFRLRDVLPDVVLLRRENYWRPVDLPIRLVRRGATVTDPDRSHHPDALASLSGKSCVSAAQHPDVSCHVQRPRDSVHSGGKRARA